MPRAFQSWKLQVKTDPTLSKSAPLVRRPGLHAARTEERQAKSDQSRQGSVLTTGEGKALNGPK